MLRYNRFLYTFQQLFAKTGTSSKPTEIYGNYSKNTQSLASRQTKSKKAIGGIHIENDKAKKFNIPSRT